jgi:hemolysin type calcium-binding protein
MRGLTRVNERIGREQNPKGASLRGVRVRSLLAAAAVVCVAATLLPGGAMKAGAQSRVLTCTIKGTTRNDVLRATKGNDIICGRGGRDLIFGGNGTDILRGGPGGDILHPGFGYDAVRGGSGADLVSYAGHTNPVLVNLRRKVGFGMGTVPPEMGMWIMCRTGT